MNAFSVHHVSRRLGVLVAIVAATIAWEAGATEQDAPHPAPLSYRRIFVPADKPAAWPTQGQVFLPVKADEFEAWVATANQPVAKPSLVDAHYEARLEGGRLAAGRATWQIELQGDRPGLLPWPRPSFIVENPRWAKYDQPAQLGWWANGVHGLRVPKSDGLKFAWHSRPGQFVGRELRIPLELPVAQRSQFVLEMPGNKVPTIDGGVLISKNVLPEPAGNWRRYVFALGNNARRELRIVDAVDSERDVLPQMVFHERLRYELSPRGLDIAATLRLEYASHPPRELRFDIPRDVHLTSANCDGRPLKWRIEAAEAGARAVVELPDSRPKNSATLTLRTWSELKDSDPWRLPKLQPADAFWSSGTFEIVVDDSLELRDARPSECIRRRPEASATDDAPSAPLEFDAYLPSATVDISVLPRETLAHVRKGMVLEVGNSSIAGRLVAQLSIDHGRLHSVSLPVRPGWRIESIETVPTEALTQWHVDVRDGRDTVELQFSDGVAAGEAVTIVSMGRLQRDAPFDPLPRELVTMLDWQGFTVSRNLLRLRAAEPFDLEPIGELAAIPPTELTDGDRGLVAGAAEEPVYDLQRAEPNLAVRLAPKRGVYNAEIELDATLVGRELKSKYHIVCQPQGSGIEEVLVYFSEPLASEPRWVDGDSGEPIHAERAPTDDPRFGGLPPGGELWDLDLRGLYARPVTILASVDLPWSEKSRVPHASLPEAEMQRGRIVVRSANQRAPAIDAHDTSPAPLPAASDTTLPDAPPRAHAVYHYAPVEFYSPATPPQVLLNPVGNDTSANRLIATEVAVESFYAGDSIAFHRVRYQLENHGTESIAFRLSAATWLDFATLDGASIPVMRSPGEPRRISLRLPPQQSVSLELQLRSDVGDLANGESLPSPLPEMDGVAVLQGRWMVWLPVEFSAFGDALAGNNTFDWRHRLFGPLARPSGEGIFNPLRRDDWHDLVPAGTARPVMAAVSANGDRTSIAPAGWHAFQATFISMPPEAVTVVRPATTGAYALTAFLVSALSGTLLTIRLMPWVLASAAAALMCILLPPAYAPIATGVFLGLLIAPACRHAWRRQEPNRSNPPSANAAVRSMVGGSVVAVGAALMIARGAAAESPTTLAAPTLEHVLVPTDSQQQPVGSKLYLSDGFFRELLRRSNGQDEACGWVLRSLRCRGEIATRDETGRAADRWALECDVETLARDIIIELPLRQSDAAWADNAFLDGIPARLAWQESGEGCAITAPEPGRHQLVIRFAPQTKNIDGRNDFSLAIPPVFGAKIRLESSQPLSDPTVNGEMLPSNLVAGHQVWETESGGAGALNISWRPATVSQAGPNSPIDELQWLTIDDDGIELRVKYVVDDHESVPEFLSISADSRWEVVGDVHERANEADAKNGRYSLQLPLVPVSDQRHEATLRFRLQHSVSLGRLQVPGVQLSTSRAVRRTLGVSTAPTIECEPVSIAALGTGAEADFAGEWGESTAPNVALNLAGTKPGWHLVLRPRNAATTEAEPQEKETDLRANDTVAQATHDSAEAITLETGAVTVDHSPPPVVAVHAGAKRRAGDAGKSARIRLCETATYTGPRGGEFAVTRFVVDPQGLDECMMVLPADQRVVRLTLDGDPPLSQRIAGQRWRVQLRSPDLPQILEVITRRDGRVDAGRGIVVLERPILERDGQPIASLISLWSLCRPVSPVRPVAKAAAPLTTTEHAILRLDQMANISEGATGTVIESSSADGYNWFVRWKARLRAIQGVARAQQLPSAEATTATRVQTLDDPLDAAVARTEAWITELEEVFSAAEPLASSAAVAGIAAPQDGAMWAHFVNDSQQPTLEVELIPTATTPAQSRTIVVISIVGLALAASWIARFRTVAVFLAEWPQLATAALGVAAWLWLRPSWLGLAVAAAALALALRQAYLRRHDLAAMSTFVRKK